MLILRKKKNDFQTINGTVLNCIIFQRFFEKWFLKLRKCFSKEQRHGVGEVPRLAPKPVYLAMCLCSVVGYELQAPLIWGSSCS